MTCRRCKGKGELPHYGHVMGGICFKCDGSGDEELGKQLRRERNMIIMTEEQKVEGMKYAIAIAYLRQEIQKKVISKDQKEEVEFCHEGLKKRGIELTLEEIKTLAKELEEEEEMDII